MPLQQRTCLVIPQMYNGDGPGTLGLKVDKNTTKLNFSRMIRIDMKSKISKVPESPGCAIFLELSKDLVIWDLKIIPRKVYYACRMYLMPL